MDIDYDRIREVTKIGLRLGHRAWDIPSIEFSIVYQTKAPQGADNKKNDVRPKSQAYTCTINPKNQNDLFSLYGVLKQLRSRKLISQDQLELAKYNVQNLRQYGWVIKQDYGPKADNVPPELNSHRVIEVNGIPYDDRSLLMKDMGLGDRLVSPKIAHAQLERSRELSRVANEAFQEMLKRLPPQPSEDILLYVDWQ